MGDLLQKISQNKIEIVTDSKGRTLRVSKPYEGRIHDFEIRKTEGPLPAVPILTDSGYQGLQNDHSTEVILPKKKPKNGSLSASEQARNTKLARCRIVVEHTFAHLKKWRILAARYRGPLDNYTQIFQTIAGIYSNKRTLIFVCVFRFFICRIVLNLDRNIYFIKALCVDK